MAKAHHWPAHPAPLPDELLSSWIVRIAETNGVKLQTLTRLLFGQDLTPWNRDIDRSAPEWLVDALQAHTGFTKRAILSTSMRSYPQLFFGRPRISGQFRWLLPAKTNSTTRLGFGMQYCPACFAADKTPYFRRRWRIGFHTVCFEHNCLMQDACPRCNAAIVFHRHDFWSDIRKARPICGCHACGFDLRDCETGVPPKMPVEVQSAHEKIIQPLLLPKVKFADAQTKCLAVLHQLCKIMMSGSNQGALHRYVAEQLGIEPLSIELTRGVAFEQRRLTERHQVFCFALWLLGKPRERLRQAWEAKAVRYNLLTKDFEGAPGWYLGILEGMNRGNR